MTPDAAMWGREAAPLLLGGAYFLGSVPFGYVIPRLARGIDIRTVGSGNIGATNVARAMGRKWAILVFALDLLKGAVPSFLGARAGGPALGAAAGMAAVCGHNWSYFLAFRGGKGVATTAGVFLALFPPGVGVALAVWAACLKLTRYVSLSSILAGVALVLCAFTIQHDPLGADLAVTVLACLAAALSIARHRANIGRLMRGKEHRI